MRWTAQAETGEVASVDGPVVTFHDGAVLKVTEPEKAPPYTPLYGVSTSGVACLLYRGHHDDSVRCLIKTKRGPHALLLADRVEGKWPLALAVIDDVFETAWLGVGRLAIHSALVLESGDIIRSVRPRVISGQPLVLLTYEGHRWETVVSDGVTQQIRVAGVARVADGDVDDGDPISIRRGAVEMRLKYHHRVGTRTVGADGRPGAPNQLVLADHDGFYLVASGDPCVQFPARLSHGGNVTFFEGGYRRYDEIRAQPFDPNASSAPPVIVVPEPPPVPEPMPTPPAQPERTTPAALPVPPAPAPTPAPPRVATFRGPAWILRLPPRLRPSKAIQRALGWID